MSLSVARRCGIETEIWTWAGIMMAMLPAWSPTYALAVSVMWWVRGQPDTLIPLTESPWPANSCPVTETFRVGEGGAKHGLPQKVLR